MPTLLSLPDELLVEVAYYLNTTTPFPLPKFLPDPISKCGALDWADVDPNYDQPSGANESRVLRSTCRRLRDLVPHGLISVDFMGLEAVEEDQYQSKLACAGVRCVSVTIEDDWSSLSGTLRRILTAYPALEVLILEEGDNGRFIYRSDNEDDRESDDGREDVDDDMGDNDEDGPTAREGCGEGDNGTSDRDNDPLSVHNLRTARLRALSLNLGNLHDPSVISLLAAPLRVLQIGPTEPVCEPVVCSSCAGTVFDLLIKQAPEMLSQLTTLQCSYVVSEDPLSSGLREFLNRMPAAAPNLKHVALVPIPRWAGNGEGPDLGDDDIIARFASMDAEPVFEISANGSAVTMVPDFANGLAAFKNLESLDLGIDIVLAEADNIEGNHSDAFLFSEESSDNSHVPVVDVPSIVVGAPIEKRCTWIQSHDKSYSQALLYLAARAALTLATAFSAACPSLRRGSFAVETVWHGDTCQFYVGDEPGTISSLELVHEEGQKSQDLLQILKLPRPKLDPEVRAYMATRSHDV